jgi:hypothetical protein
VGYEGGETVKVVVEGVRGWWMSERKEQQRQTKKEMTK